MRIYDIYIYNIYIIYIYIIYIYIIYIIYIYIYINDVVTRYCNKKSFGKKIKRLSIKQQLNDFKTKKYRLRMDVKKDVD